MGPSCDCDWDKEPGSWAWYNPDDFSKLDTPRRKRCKSCNELIDVGATCLKFDRIRAPYTDIEEAIKGDEIYATPYYQCEKCGEMWLNLTAAGYCIQPDYNMQKEMSEYHKMTGFVPGRGPGQSAQAAEREKAS